MMLRIPAFFAMAAMAAAAAAQDQNDAQQPPPRLPPAPQNPQAQQDPAQPGQARPGQVQPGQAQPGRFPAGQERGAGLRGNASANELDSIVADCLVLANKEEIALLRFGEERTQNEQVRQLAQRMIQDHEKAVQSLSRFAARAQNVELQATAPGIPGRALAATREARRVGTEQRAETDANRNPAPAAPGRPQTQIADRGVQPQAGQGGTVSDQLFEIEREAHQNCLQLVQQDLAKHQGQEFDGAFLGYQIGMHTGMLAKLKAIEGRVSGELQQVVQQAQQTTQEHKQQVEQLKQQLTSAEGEGARGAAAPRTQPPGNPAPPRTQTPQPSSRNP